MGLLSYEYYARTFSQNRKLRKALKKIRQNIIQFKIYENELVYITHRGIVFIYYFIFEFNDVSDKLKSII